MNTERIRDRFMPWAGIALGTLGAGFAHQLGADSTFQDCRVGSPLIIIIGTIVGLAIIGSGALISWRIYAADGETPARHMIATVSVLASGLFALAVVIPFIAAMIIPGCWQ